MERHWNERSGDFLSLLREGGHPFAVRQNPAGAAGPDAGAPGYGTHGQGLPGYGTPGAGQAVIDTHGTTVIAVKYDKGVLNVGDRRATANNAIMYDRAEKVIALDDHCLISISGSYARSLEVIRFLRSSFKYYARTQLQEMSLDGKLNELSRIIAGNLASAMQGVGMFIPVLSAYDLDAQEGRIFFYDAMGARFETDEFAAAGSGSERIRGSFDYIVRTKGPFRKMSLDEALYESMVLLDIAADLDSATGGYSKILPVAKTVSAEGVTEIAEEDIRKIAAKVT